MIPIKVNYKDRDVDGSFMDFHESFEIQIDEHYYTIERYSINGEVFFCSVFRDIIQIKTLVVPCIFEYTEEELFQQSLLWEFTIPIEIVYNLQKKFMRKKAKWYPFQFDDTVSTEYDFGVIL